jgi:hypothetical protein
MIMDGLENSAHASRLNLMISRATDQLIEMQAKDKNKFTGQQWLDEQEKGDFQESTSSEKIESSPEPKKVKSRLGRELEAEQIVSDEEISNADVVEEVEEIEPESVEEADEYVAIAPKRPLIKKARTKVEKVNLKPAIIAETEVLSSVEPPVEEAKETTKPYTYMPPVETVSKDLTEFQQNIKTVFIQIMESNTANQQKTAVSFIEYCIRQTRNTFGLATVVEEMELNGKDSDVIVSQSNEEWEELELGKYYLEYLLEDVEFLRYLEADELILPKVTTRIKTDKWTVKETNFVRTSLQVSSSFTKGREYDILARLLKISADMEHGLAISNALRTVKGGITITLDSKTRLPRSIQNDLQESKLSYAKLVGNELQEQLITVDNLKFDDKLQSSPDTSVISPEITLSAPDDDDDEIPEYLKQFDDKDVEEDETVVPIETKEPVEETPKAQLEEVSEPEAELEQKQESLQITEEQYRTLLRFFAQNVIDTDYKGYLRMSWDEQEKDLILDLQSYLTEFDDIEQTPTYKQAVKFSQRLKKIYEPLAEISIANGYKIEELRDIEYFSDFRLDEDDFYKRDTIYLYNILLGIQEIWKQVQQNQDELERAEAEEKERLENERLEQERLEQERQEAERIEAEAREQAEKKAEAERLEQERLEAESTEPEQPESEEQENPESKETDDSENDAWLADFDEEEVDPEFNLDDEVVNADSKKSKKERKRDKKPKKDVTPLIDLSGDENEATDESKLSKKAIVGLTASVVVILGMGGAGMWAFSNHLSGNRNQTTAQSSSQQAQNKINVLQGNLNGQSQVTFIDSNNSNKLSPNPYDKLVLAHSSNLTTEQLSKLNITDKTSLTITDGGQKTTITVAGVVNSKDVSDLGIAQLKGASYVKWIDSNNVPYFMPFK